MPIQGTAADMMKLAMINVHGRMKKEGMNSRIILQIHDELVFDALKDEVDALRDLVKHEMESAMTLGEVPILVETGVGENWQEAH
jgi:DNA polymerase-1